MTRNSVTHSRADASQPDDARAAVTVALLAGLLAVLARWYFTTHAQILQPLYTQWGDAAEYYRYAWNLVHHGVFSSETIGTVNPSPDSFRDPGYPVFLALSLAMIHDYDRWYAVVLLGQSVLGGVSVACAVLAMRDFLPTWLLATAGTAIALWPHLVVLPAYVLSENLSTFCCAVSALALGEASRRRSIPYTVVAGLAMAVAALTNAVLAPLILPFALVFGWKRTMTPRQLTVLVAVVAIPLLAWNIRNSTVHGPYSPTFRAEVNLVQGSWPTYHLASQLAARHDPVGTQTIDAIALEIAALHVDPREGFRRIRERMSQAPGTYIGWYVSKPALLWGWEIGLGAGDIYMYPTRNSPFMIHPVFKAIEGVAYTLNGAIAVLALVGLTIALLRRDSSASMLAFAITTAWITLVYAALQSDARYSIPYRAGEIALACLTVAATIERIGHRQVAAQ
jgi:hypothetical protein